MTSSQERRQLERTNGYLADQMQRFVAYTSVGASTVRGQRSPGLVRVLRTLLYDVDLAAFSTCPTSDFSELLNDETRRIKNGMPLGTRHWGIARKVLNIFLRGANYNWLLRQEFGLARLDSVMELPLDSLTAKALKANSPPRSLPRWRGVKHLAPVESALFQLRACEIAAGLGIDCVHLDIFWWVDRKRRYSRP